MTEPDIVLPDPRRVRRAVRWGVVRTAASAVGCLFIALVLLVLLGGTFDAALGRSRRFERVVGTAFVISQPDYDWGQTMATPSAPLFYGNGMRVTGRLRGIDAGWGPAASKRLYQNVLGHLGYTSADPAGPVADALRRGRPTPAETRGLLAALPAHSRAIAVVELRSPLSWDGRSAFLRTEVASAGGVVWLEPPYTVFESPGRSERHPLTWADPVPQRTFPEWVDDLRDSDAPNLRPFGLPSIAELREMRRAPKVYAYLTSTVDVAELSAIAQRPNVLSVRLVDVGLPLG